MESVPVRVMFTFAVGFLHITYREQGDGGVPLMSGSTPINSVFSPNFL